ncbi:MAG: DUF6588 family protein [Tunicatimonas sp.]
MKRNFLNIITATVLGTVAATPALAQSDLNTLMRAGLDDATTLLDAYTAPLGQSTGANMNAGWVNAAAPLKSKRFELKLIGNVAYVPEGRRSFSLDALGFNAPTTREVDGRTFTEVWQYKFSEAPTVFGAAEGEERETIRKVVTYENPVSGFEEKATVAELTLPEGLDLALNPLTPAMQLNVGVPLGTEVMIRFLPSTNIVRDETTFTYNGLLGVGLKHDIKQWVPYLRQLPVSFSLAAAYSNTRASLAFPSILPEAPTGTTFADSTRANTNYQGPSVTDADYSGQGAEFRVQAWNVNALVSREFTLVSVYGGVRYARSTTTLQLRGTYGVADVPYYNTENPTDSNNRLLTLVNFTDPIESKTAHGQASLVGGFRFKLGFLALSGEATLSRFSTASLGISAGWMDLVPARRGIKKNLNKW